MLLTKPPIKKRFDQTDQEVLDQLFWRHGCNLPEWSQYPDILKEAGLDPATITPEMQELSAGRLIGMANAKLSQNGSAHDEPLEWLGPREKKLKDGTPYHQWRTTCDQCRVARLGLSDGGARFVVEVENGTPGEHEILASDLKSLHRAISSAEAYYGSKHGLKRVESNSYDVIGRSAEMGLAGKQPTPAPKVAKVKQVQEPRARQRNCEVDPFGQRRGTQAAEINAIFIGNPDTVYTVPEVSDKTQLNKGRVKKHFDYLVDRGFCEREGKGIKLKK